MATLQIIDHGKGMPPEKLEGARQQPIGTLGVGVRGMTERIKQLGGTLRLESGIEGTTVTATVPLPD
jgi:signal transduction histidine kinase